MSTVRRFDVFLFSPQITSVVLKVLCCAVLPTRIAGTGYLWHTTEALPGALYNPAAACCCCCLLPGCAMKLSRCARGSIDFCRFSYLLAAAVVFLLGHEVKRAACADCVLLLATLTVSALQYDRRLNGSLRLYIAVPTLRARQAPREVGCTD